MIRRQKNKKDDHRRPPSPQKAPVFSYYTTRPSDDSKTTSSRPHASGSTRKGLSQIPILLAVTAIVASLLYTLAVDTKPRIELLADQRGNALLRDRETYQQAGQRVLDSSIMNRTKLTINTADVAKELKSMFPELAQVEVTTPIVGRRLIFELKPVRPAVILSSDTSGSFVVDEQGRAVVKTSEVSRLDRRELPSIIDSSGLGIEEDMSVLTTESIVFIQTVIAQLKVKGLSVSTASLPPIANELHVRLSGQKYYIKFNTERDARKQVGRFMAVKEKLDGDNKIPSQYVDVRVDEKAYYK